MRSTPARRLVPHLADLRDTGRNGQDNRADRPYHGRFVRLVPNERVMEVMEFETANETMRGERRVTFRLTDTGAGTDVLAVHDNLPPGVTPTDSEAGWREALDKLAGFVETGDTRRAGCS